MNEHALPPEQFEQFRPRLRAVAYRMLGSLSEADDAVQDTWLRASQADASVVDNIGGGVTTVAARGGLNIVRARGRRREGTPGGNGPHPVVGPAAGGGREGGAALGRVGGPRMWVRGLSLTPDERLAFVLHDMFAVPFDSIAPLLERSPAATRQLASRSRRRVREQAPAPDPDPALQREVVDAYLSAARQGDFDALVGVLHPDVVLRSDGGTARARFTTVLRGVQQVTGPAVDAARRLAPFARPALVNGAAGVVTVAGGRVLSVMGFTVVAGKIVAIDVLMDPDRLAELHIAELGLD